MDIVMFRTPNSKEMSEYQKIRFYKNTWWQGYDGYNWYELTDEQVQVHIDHLEARIEELEDVLEDCQNGLKWYAESYPEGWSKADDEINERIDKLLTPKK